MQDIHTLVSRSYICIYIYIYIYIYIQKTDEENTIYLVLRVSCYQSSAKYIYLNT